MRILQVGDLSVGVLQEEQPPSLAVLSWCRLLVAARLHCHHDPLLSGWWHEAYRQGPWSFTCVCNQVLVNSASTAAYTPHGFAYNVLHKSIIAATYPKGQPPFHYVFYVVSSNYARTFLQDTHGKDQGAFGISLPFTNAREFPCHHRDDPVADFPFGWIVHWVWVRNHTILPLLPDAVIANAPNWVMPIIAMDHVTVDRD